jgi:hypothetical protein
MLEIKGNQSKLDIERPLRHAGCLVTVVSRYLTFIENSKSSGSRGWSNCRTRVLANRGPAKTVIMGAR